MKITLGRTANANDAPNRISPPVLASCPSVTSFEGAYNRPKRATKALSRD